MIGAPGSGKSMLAKRVPSILPPLTQQDYDEICAIYRLAGLQYRSTMPPFQAPHNTASYAALVGGGSSQPRPGMISLAHNGVLFLDELPEFNRNALEALRQPLEDGKVTIHTHERASYLPGKYHAYRCNESMPVRICSKLPVQTRSDQEIPSADFRSTTRQDRCSVPNSSYESHAIHARATRRRIGNNPKAHILDTSETIRAAG
jgi:Magnesium chelatase, subunit ChlI